MNHEKKIKKQQNHTKICLLAIIPCCYLGQLFTLYKVKKKKKKGVEYQMGFCFFVDSITLRSEMMAAFEIGVKPISKCIPSSRTPP